MLTQGNVSEKLQTKAPLARGLYLPGGRQVNQAARRVRRSCVPRQGLLALLRPKQPAVRGQAFAGVACRRRQKKYESPQSTPVAAAQLHASGPSSCGRRPFSRCVAHCPTWWHTGSTNPLHTTNSRTPVAPNSPTVVHRAAKTSPIQRHAPELFRKSTSGGKLPNRRRRTIHPAPPTPRILNATSGPNRSG